MRFCDVIHGAEALVAVGFNVALVVIMFSVPLAEKTWPNRDVYIECAFHWNRQLVKIDYNSAEAPTPPGAAAAEATAAVASSAAASAAAAAAAGRTRANLVSWPVSEPVKRTSPVGLKHRL